MGDPLFVLLAYRFRWIPERPGKVWLQLYEREYYVSLRMTVMSSPSVSFA